MFSKWLGSHRFDRNAGVGRRSNTAKPVVESLESKLLLYSTLGANWTFGSRITYSFVPDGTNVGGFSSNLYSTLNAKFSTATWQAQFQKAAALWETYANINLVNVSDNGSAIGSGSYQQGDPGVGDIRISMAPLGSSQLACAFLPPPINGGSDAGDIVFNSSINWQINSSYDIMTVALHEFGHALGLDHSTLSTADMYAYYNGIKQTPTSDDIAGIQAVYGAPQLDRFDSVSSNNTYTTATNITSYLDSKAQISLSGLSLNSTSDTDWYYVTAPAGTNGTLTVTMQSSNLSSLSPRILLYNSSLAALGQATAPNTYGATVSVTITGVTAGQGFYIRSLAASSPGAVGAYGLLVNFGAYSQSPISPPNTQVLAAADQGGGTAYDSVASNSPGNENNNGNGNAYAFGRSNRWNLSSDDVSQVGTLQGWGDSLTIGSATHRFVTPNYTALANLSPVAIATLDVVAAWTGQLFDPKSGNPTSGTSGVDNALPSNNFAQSTRVLQAIDNTLTQWDSDKNQSLLGDRDDS